MEFVKIVEEHQGILLPMVEEFYQSNAVDHPVDRCVMEATVKAVADQEDPLVWGYFLSVEGEFVGYCMLTAMFACEVGGKCVMIEDIFLREGQRGHGYGRLAMEEIIKKHPEAKRFRLEVTASNQGAKKLYRSLGFEMLAYEQMVRDSGE